MGRWAPWLHGQVPARLWRKVVAAYQGIVLTVAAAGVLPAGVAAVAVGTGLGLLVVSFGTEVVDAAAAVAARRTSRSRLPGQALSRPPSTRRVLP